jgi:CheY-like chemotaxis protein
MDYGIVDLALAGDNYQLDIFGSTINICSKINSYPSLASKNEIIIGNNFYRILKSFPNIINKYDFINNGEFKITENIAYPTYSIKRKNNTLLHNDDNTNSTYSIIRQNKPNSSVEDNIENQIKKRRFLFNKKNDKRNKKIIIVDDEEDILFTYRSYLDAYDYDITCFKDPTLVLDYIQDLQDFNDLVVLDIRMKNLNGLQLHQQIRAIDPTIKIIFITALDILDELLSIFPGISREQILKKPIDKNLFAHTVKNILN